LSDPSCLRQIPLESGDHQWVCALLTPSPSSYVSSDAIPLALCAIEQRVRPWP
jgi:hypothetical protein